MEFVTRSFDTPDNYVKVEQAVESDEIEYEYSIYENGRLVSKTKVEWEDPEFEDDDDDKGLTMQFKSDSGDGYSKTKYHVIKDKNNRLRVTYKPTVKEGAFSFNRRKPKIYIPMKTATRKPWPVESTHTRAPELFSPNLL